MTYTTGYYYMPRYEFANRNQHGERYKRKPAKQICTSKLSCKRDNASDLEDLVVLGHTLNAPVHYDFKTGMAYIEIMSGDAVRQG